MALEQFMPVGVRVCWQEIAIAMVIPWMQQGVCGGDCTTDADADGECDDVDGCADLTACNYLNAAAEYCLFEDECGGMWWLRHSCWGL